MNNKVNIKPVKPKVTFRFTARMKRAIEKNIVPIMEGLKKAIYKIKSVISLRVNYMIGQTRITVSIDEFLKMNEAQEIAVKIKSISVISAGWNKIRLSEITSVISKVFESCKPASA